MRKNFGSKPWTYPQPVFIVAAYDENEKPCAMNAAWGGIHYDDQIALCLGSEHKTVDNILKSKAFTVSMATVEHLVACDYVGVESGNKEPDKFSKAGFHATKSEFVNAPIINELPMTIECRLVSYDPKSCHLVGEIVNVSADESIIDNNGKIDPQKLRPITFDPVNNAYLAVGEKVGNAFRDGLALKKN
ncbi:MAG: flavin reductase family protein [Muribaculaceae bacterium]|nr:flavin reductase family protein [Muribaculaceae bacterium]